MKTLVLFLSFIPFVSLLTEKNIFQNSNNTFIADANKRLLSKEKEALEFCKTNNYDTTFCILIDMKIHSGKNRLFVWNFQNDSVLEKGLCSHGCGEYMWGEDETKTSPIFSNTPDSHCSSNGKYKIGKRGYSQWGINVNYKLHGLESTNKNAYKRYIVLHSWEMIPSNQPYPEGTPEGWGCPAVSNEIMKKLDSRLKKSTKPVLLWIFN